MGRSPLFKALKTNLLCFWLGVQRGITELCPDPWAQQGQMQGSLLPFLLLQADAPSEQNKVILTHENDLWPRLEEPSPRGVCSPVRRAMLLQFGACPDPSTTDPPGAPSSWEDSLAIITQPQFAACFVHRGGKKIKEQIFQPQMPFPATTASRKDGRE